MKLNGDVRIKSLTVTQRQLANALGISPARINQLVKDEIVIRDNENQGGAVFLYESVKRYWMRNASGEENSVLDLTKERAEHERTKRKIAELRLAKMERNVYSAKTVELVMTEMLSNLRTQLLGLPSKLAPQLSGKTKEQIYSLLTTELEEKLAELSAYSPELFAEEIEENADDENGE